MGRVISIEQNYKLYTEESKYYNMSLSELEIVFKDRFLDWDYYLQDSMSKASKSSGQWSLSVIDFLTTILYHDYDYSIKDFYNKCKKSRMKNSDIYYKFAHDFSMFEDDGMQFQFKLD